MKVVLDTNVLVSALVFPGGPPERIYRLAIEGAIRLVTSPPLLAELGRVLTDNRWDPGHTEAAVAQLVRVGEIVEPTVRVDVVSDDPDDDRVLEAAAAADAAVIVSGDRHLLDLEAWHDVTILTPSGFLAAVESGDARRRDMVATRRSWLRGRPRRQPGPRVGGERQARRVSTTSERTSARASCRSIPAIRRLS